MSDNNVTQMVPVSISFRGPRQLSQYRLANDAAIKAGTAHAKANGRQRWTLDDFDAAKKEFTRVLDGIALSEAMDKQREA